jgi:hypothetical protein
MRAEGGSVSHHDGKHHVAHHGDHDEVHHHHYEKGGEVKEDSIKGMESYTAKPNEEEEEAEGKMRAKGGKVRRARGGHVKERKEGGMAMKHVEMEGHKTKHRRLDRPGRKRGGGVGADMTPLSSAARARQGTAHSADADELADT